MDKQLIRENVIFLHGLARGLDKEGNSFGTIKEAVRIILEELAKEDTKQEPQPNLTSQDGTWHPLPTNLQGEVHPSVESVKAVSDSHYNKDNLKKWHDDIEKKIVGDTSRVDEKLSEPVIFDVKSVPQDTYCPVMGDLQPEITYKNPNKKESS